MTKIQILHNPRCSKSRQTLQLLQDKGHQVEIINYLQQVPSKQQLSELVSMLGFHSARELMRHKEAEYKAQNLDDSTLDEDTLLAAMVSTPKLIERPIVIHNKQARIGRPPEQVLEIL